MKFIVPILFLSLLVSACGKYENGSKFTLLSKKARVVNSWKLEKSTLNGEPTTFAGNENTHVFKKNFDYQILGEANQNQPAEQNGSWKFGDKKETIIIELDGSSDTLKISRLKNKSMWLEREFSSGSILLFEYTAE